MRWYRLSKYINSLPKPFCYFREVPRKYIEIRFSCYISPKSDIDAGTYFPHPVGVVIGDGVVVAGGCTIYQGVTLGAARRGEGSMGRYPKLGERVTVYAGAVLVGDIRIGDDSVVAANAVLNKSFPSLSVVGGIPGKIISGAKEK